MTALRFVRLIEERDWELCDLVRDEPDTVKAILKMEKKRKIFRIAAIIFFASIVRLFTIEEGGHMDPLSTVALVSVYLISMGGFIFCVGNLMFELRHDYASKRLLEKLTILERVLGRKIGEVDGASPKEKAEAYFTTSAKRIEQLQYEEKKYPWIEMKSPEMRNRWEEELHTAIEMIDGLPSYAGHYFSRS
jgi:hypothetical protein